MKRSRKLTDRELGIAGYVAVDAPTRRKGDGAYVIRTVQAPYHDGETPDVARAFADAQLASLATYRAAHPVQPCAPVAKCKHAGPANIYGTGDQSGPHTAGCQYLAARTGNVYGSAADVAEVRRLAAQLDARKGRPAGKAALRRGHAILAKLTAPEPDTYAAAIARVTTPEPTTPNALTICNACDIRPMVGPEHPGYAAGLCSACFAEANAPEPIDLAADPEPERCDRCAMVGHTAVDCIVASPAPFALPDPVAPADALAPEPERCWYYHHAAGITPERCTLPDGHEPAASPDGRGGGHLYPSMAPEPALAIVPEPRTRPTCERCGQTFRLSGNGYAWHVANRPDCAAAARPSVAA